MTTKEVFQAIKTELNFISDKEKLNDTHITDSFPLSSGLTAIRHNLAKAEAAWYEGRDPHPKAMDILRKIAAICVKMGDQYGMPARYFSTASISQPVTVGDLDPTTSAQIMCDIKHLITDLPTDTIRPGHRQGNTSRQLNQAIEWLMEGKAVYVIDHSLDPQANRRIVSLIIRRLRSEYPHLVSTFAIDSLHRVIAPAESLFTDRKFIILSTLR